MSTNTAFFSLEALPNYPKNALNCAYINMAFSKHDYFDLWSPCAFWTVHRFFDKAARNENCRDIHYCVLVWVSTSVRFTLSAKNTLLCLYAQKNQSTNQLCLSRHRQSA